MRGPSDHLRYRTIRAFWTDETGTAPLYLFWFLVIMILSGLAVDPANAWRHRQFLKQTADVSAHAAAVAMSGGATTSEVRAAAANSVAINLDAEWVGNVLVDPMQDVQLLSFDPDTNTAQPANGGPANAISVRLRRDEAEGNAVALTFLRAASLFVPDEARLKDWDITVQSVTAWVPTMRCTDADMIQAGGDLDTSSNRFGSGYCVHSQQSVWMPQSNIFDPGSSISMPNLTDCNGKCTDAANPGSGSAANEMNMPTPDVDGLIDRLKTAFVDELISPEKTEFFANKGVLGNVLPLQQIGYPVLGLLKGSVVRLAKQDFARLPIIPGGLVYHVACDGSIPKLPGPGGGGGNNKSLKLDSVNAAPLRDVAIITDCAFSADSGVDISRTLLVSTSAGLNTTGQAKFGAAAGNCTPADRTLIVTRGNITIPGSFGGSNITFMTAGNFGMAGAGSNGRHHGVGIVASGDLHLSAGHEFVACNTDSALQPSALMIRHVEPVISP